MEENDLPFKGKKKIPCILAVGGRASRDLLTNFSWLHRQKTSDILNSPLILSAMQTRKRPTSDSLVNKTNYFPWNLTLSIYLYNSPYSTSSVISGVMFRMRTW